MDKYLSEGVTMRINDLVGNAHEAELRLPSLTIQENCILFNNNCVQISNISAIRLFNVKDSFPRWTLVGGLIGITLLLMKDFWMFGLLVTGLSGYFIYKHLTKNADHLIQLMTNHGFTYNIVSSNKTFSGRILQVLTEKMNNSNQGTYFIDFKDCVITDKVEGSVVNVNSEVDSVENKVIS